MPGEIRARLGPEISKSSTQFGFYSKYVREPSKLRRKRDDVQ